MTDPAFFIAHMKKAPAQKTAGRYEGNGNCGAGETPAPQESGRNFWSGRRRI
jgi:hypothetical protein